MADDSESSESSGVGNDPGAGMGHGGGSSSDADAGGGGGTGSAGSQSDAQSAENDAQGTDVGSGSGVDTRDMEEQMANPRGVAEQQSVNQAMANEMENQMAASGMTAAEIAQAMMGYTSLSQAQQQAMLDAVQNQAAAHSLSQRTYAAQLKATVVQAKVAGIKSISNNVRGFGLSLASDVLGFAMSNTLGPAIGAVANVSTVTQALGLNIAVEQVVNMTVEAVMDMANTQAMRGITGLSNNSPMGNPNNTGGDGSALRLGLQYESIAREHGYDTLSDGVDVALTILYGQVYRSRSNIIGSAFDPMRNWLGIR